ncbi:haloacid dehalogenase [Bordetella genomosp. 5]|uniref:HAD family hydrolase n=1 Tax=Bordetella genomosp. 5 TaxID=1395608 RepID=UPI000B9EBCE4|nr:HAD family hydrolase [Bordetella genomosp. 5]OZI42583.1 haloacid dehalogenase [Bordetella genomosp. 5]
MKAGILDGARRWTASALAALMTVVLTACSAPGTTGLNREPLPSWREGASRTSIIEFVSAVTTVGSPDFVEIEDRVAVFDNDGTLWSEQPLYFQGIFALDRLKALAPKHPEWKTQQPFKAALEDDQEALAKAGDTGLLKIVGATHAGVSTQAFSESVAAWTASARHPRFGRPYTDLTYVPMRELLDYLRAHDFKVYIVSGGGVEFMRAWATSAYGIPPEQIIGSRLENRFEFNDGQPQIMQDPKLSFLDDGPGKPVAINQHIGRRPILAFGNSDGDLQMLQWTAAGTGKRFAGLVHHTDDKREWAYDRTSKIGRLDRALDEARSRGWTVVDMEKEWERIFVFEEP